MNSACTYNHILMYYYPLLYPLDYLNPKAPSKSQPCQNYFPLLKNRQFAYNQSIFNSTTHLRPSQLRKHNGKDIQEVNQEYKMRNKEGIQIENIQYDRQYSKRYIEPYPPYWLPYMPQQDMQQLFCKEQAQYYNPNELNQIIKHQLDIDIDEGQKQQLVLPTIKQQNICKIDQQQVVKNKHLILLNSNHNSNNRQANNNIEKYTNNLDHNYQPNFNYNFNIQHQNGHLWIQTKCQSQKFYSSENINNKNDGYKDSSIEHLAKFNADTSNVNNIQSNPKNQFQVKQKNKKITSKKLKNNDETDQYKNVREKVQKEVIRKSRQQQSSMQFSDDQQLQEQKNYKNMQEQNQSIYPKKNTESNIVNQIFSFVSTSIKSSPIIRKFVKQDQKKVNSFYQILKAIKKRKKKYINRKYFSNLCTLSEGQIGYKMLLRSRNKSNALTIPQFQRILAMTIIYYLNNQSQINIITSKKINKNTCMQHLERRREIKTYLTENIKERQSGNQNKQKIKVQENFQ